MKWINKLLQQWKYCGSYVDFFLLGSLIFLEPNCDITNHIKIPKKNSTRSLPRSFRTIVRLYYLSPTLTYRIENDHKLGVFLLFCTPQIYGGGGVEPLHDMVGGCTIHFHLPSPTTFIIPQKTLKN